RVPFYVSACHELGIEVEPPDVNESECDFAVVDGKIRFGLNAVKNVGDSAARRIVEARKSGPFASLWDFTERVDPQVVNKRALEALVKCGAFDSTGASRKGMFDALEQARGSGAARQEGRRGGAGGGRGGGGAGGVDVRPGVDVGGRAPADHRRRVREERAAAARKGDARRVRLGASAAVDPRPAAAQDRCAAGRGGTPA